MSYGYNNDFLATSFTYAGATEALGYDNDGLLTSAGGFTIGRNAANGLPETVTDGTLTVTRSFSGYGELDGNTYTVNGAPKYSWAVTSRDGAGRILQKTETLAGETTTWDYAYDSLGRLVEVSKNGTEVESYAYDANGNRTAETNTLRSVSRTCTYSDEDHLLTAGADAYAFDFDGFLTGKSSPEGVTAYDYSSRGELLSVNLPDNTVVTYDHDPLGRRITKRLNGAIVEKYLWEGINTNLLAVYDANDTLRIRFQYADDRLPISMTYNGATYYLLTDQVGTVRAVADTAGNIVKQLDYDSFGNVVRDTAPSFPMPLGFAGGLQDRDAGLVRFGFRDYQPETGRCVAKDPIDFYGGEPNLYGYVEDNPIMNVDPRGLSDTNSTLQCHGLGTPEPPPVYIGINTGIEENDASILKPWWWDDQPKWVGTYEGTRIFGNGPDKSTWTFPAIPVVPGVFIPVPVQIKVGN